MRGRRVDMKERTRIVALLGQGKSQHAVAKEVGRNPSIISRVAREQGIESNVAATKRATEARRDYAQAERVALLNEAFDRGRQLLGSAELEAKDFKDVMTGLAIAIDKRRLEDGEATSRAEVSTTEARQKVLARIDELAARRKA